MTPIIWTVISILINIGLLIATMWASWAAKKSAAAAENSAQAARDLVEQGWLIQREHWVEQIRKAIEPRLPTSNLNHDAGLPVAGVIDDMPPRFSEEREAIVRSGFHRAGVAGGFQGFWAHLCEIQGWPSPRDAHPQAQNG